MSASRPITFSALLLTTATTFSGLSLPAAAGFSANLGLESEYLRDGISQSSGDYTAQWGAGYSHNAGFYGGIWGSELKRNDDSADAEWDFYAGYSRYLTDNLGIDLGYNRYTFHGDWEVKNTAYNESYVRILYADSWVAGWKEARKYLGSPYDKRSLELSYTFHKGSFDIGLFAARHKLEEIDEDFHYGEERRDNYWQMRISLERSYNQYDYRLGISRTNLNSEFDAGTTFTFGIHRYFDF